LCSCSAVSAVNCPSEACVFVAALRADFAKRDTGSAMPGMTRKVRRKSRTSMAAQTPSSASTCSESFAQLDSACPTANSTCATSAVKRDSSAPECCVSYQRGGSTSSFSYSARRREVSTFCPTPAINPVCSRLASAFTTATARMPSGSVVATWSRGIGNGPTVRSPPLSTASSSGPSRAAHAAAAPAATTDASTARATVPRCGRT
jgi:hypothetical protein